MSALSAQADAIELTTFSSNEAKILGAEQTTLRNAAKRLSGLAPRLRGAANTPAFKSTAIVVAGLILGQDIIVPLYFFTGTKDPLRTTPIEAFPPTPTGPGGEDNSVVKEWYLNTVRGLSVKEFQDWIKTLPDKGSGTQYVYEGAFCQAYVGRWTEEESILINEDPHVDQQVPNGLARVSFNSNHTFEVFENTINRRAFDYQIIQRPGSLRHQKIISLNRNVYIHNLPDNLPVYDYALEDSKGEGIFVYVFDTGFDWTHEVYSIKC